MWSPHTIQDPAITFTLLTDTPHIVNSLSDTEVPYSGIRIFTLTKHYYPLITRSQPDEPNYPVVN
jgi:hypothetical protein